MLRRFLHRQKSLDANARRRERRPQLCSQKRQLSDQSALVNRVDPKKRDGLWIVGWLSVLNIPLALGFPSAFATFGAELRAMLPGDVHVAAKVDSSIDWQRSKLDYSA
jgi:hypothetical protein